jgi:ketosteroid isomerase-like protein
MTHRSTLAGLGAVTLATAAPALAQETGTRSAQTAMVEPQARQAAAVVDAFHAAIAAGDIPTALARLSDDAVVFEAGNVERGKAEYAEKHAAADAEFAKQVSSRIVRRSGRTSGDTAWILTESRSTGTYKERPLDRMTTETMMLTRQGGVWRIIHIHWSSATARPQS